VDIHLITLRKTLLYLFVAIVAVVCSTDTALAQTNTLTVAPLSLAFTSTAGTPQPQFLSVSSSTGNLTFSTSVEIGGNYFGVTPTGGTAATDSMNNVQVYIPNPNLVAGTYDGVIEVTAGSQVISVSVTYTVGTGTGGGGAGPVAASPTSLTFSTAVNGTAASQTLTLSTTGAQISVTVQPVETSPVGGTWLSVNPSSATISSSASKTETVSVSPAGLAQGSYSGYLNVFVNNSTTPALQVLVTLNVGTSTGLNVAVTPASLTYNIVSASSGNQTQTLTVTNSTNQIQTVTATSTVTAGIGWLTVTPTTETVAADGSNQFSVTVNPLSLGIGTFTGNIAVTVGTSETINVGVTVNVGSIGTSEISATPNPLTLTIPAGSTVQTYPNTLTVTTTSFSTVSFTAVAASTGNWLSVTQGGVQTVTNNAPDKLTVNVDPIGFVTGQTYSGTITLTPTDGSTPFVVPVNVTVGSTPFLTINPTNLAFAYQAGTAFPPAQSLSLSSSGIAIAFNAAASTTTGGNWLIVSPQSGATAASGAGTTNLTVQVNPTGLAAGSYNGLITVTATGASNTTQTIPVTLLVSNLPILNLSASSVTFNYQYGTSTLPGQQQVQVISSGNPLNYTTTVSPESGGNFLVVTPSSGTTPQSLNLSINPSVLATLAAGMYSATVTVNALGAGNTPVNLNVYLMIGNNTLLNPSQAAFVFNYEVGKSVPAVQTFNITSTGAPIEYTATATSTNCGTFLSVSPATNTTPGTVAVAVNVSGAPVGTCKGTITIATSSSDVTVVGNSPLTIPVTLNVSNSPLLNVSPQAVSVTAALGTSPANQIIALTSTDPATALMFNVTSTTNNGTGWLLVGPTSGSTPNNLTIGFQTDGLGVGTYTGSITVTPTATGSTPTTIPVTVVIVSGNTASVSPTTLTFSQPYGGSAPAAQPVQVVSSTAGLSFSASAVTYSGGTWLSVTPANGTTPGTIMVSANGPGLGQGSYSGVVTVVIPGAANTPLNIPVTLTIGPALTLTATPTSVAFTYQAGSGAAVPSQTVQLASTTGSAGFTLSATSTTTGLITFSSSSGTTPSTVTIGLNPTVLSTLAAGTYTGSVTVTSSTNSSTSLTINVTVTVQMAVAPSITTVLNGASDLPGAVSPGEIISIFGANVGPATPAYLALTSTGTVETTLGNTEVTFDGIAAPLIYAASGQLNAIVPYSIAGRATTAVVVTRSGLASTSLTLNVADTSPAIFSLSQGGSGQGAILNQNESVNGASNPAAPGSVISIYATGEGMLQPSGVTGSVTTSTAPFPMPMGTVSVTIGGLTAQIEYAGEAPGLVSGVLQVNAVIPAGIAPGSQPSVILTVGSASSAQQTITVAVQ
jgi:uncharacterized protein (TIGR03437 family)